MFCYGSFSDEQFIYKFIFEPAIFLTSLPYHTSSHQGSSPCLWDNDQTDVIPNVSPIKWLDDFVRTGQ